VEGAAEAGRMPSGLPARHVRLGQCRYTSTELGRMSSSEAENFSFCDYTTRSVREHPGFATIVPSRQRPAGGGMHGDFAKFYGELTGPCCGTIS
jgi:hypothetical protein